MKNLDILLVIQQCFCLISLVFYLLGSRFVSIVMFRF